MKHTVSLLQTSISRGQHCSGSALVLLAFILVLLGMASTTQGVSPPPDGGYPGGNTAEGQAALFSLTTGTYNTAVGFFSLRSNSAGSLNTAIGAGALLFSTADENTAVGAGALLSNINGEGNTANGEFTLFSNTQGGNNTATGAFTLFSNTTGSDNTAIGSAALQSNTDGGSNTAIGFEALNRNTGISNTAVGDDALFSNTTGFSNTAVGAGALGASTNGHGNIALGFQAGLNVTTAIGVIAIGTGGANVDGSCFIANIRGVTTQNPNAIPVLIDSAGQLGTASSSRRFKHHIQSMDKASEAILALKPVTFSYKTDKANTPQFGLIAEDAAEVNPALVVRDEKGEIYTVRYDAVNAMLLNEFLKEHKAFVGEQHKVETLEATVASLVATVKQQAAEIQKVSARVEITRPATKLAGDGH
jgi:Chaperone of endosialidase